MKQTRSIYYFYYSELRRFSTSMLSDDSDTKQLSSIKKPTVKRPEYKQNLDTTNSLLDFFLLSNPVILKL